MAKKLKTGFAVLTAALSFFTTVLCMRDVLAVRDEMHREKQG